MFPEILLVWNSLALLFVESKKKGFRLSPLTILSGHQWLIKLSLGKNKDEGRKRICGDGGVMGELGREKRVT